jgi:hypothetical protein
MGHTVCSCKRGKKNVRIKLNFILTFLKTSGTWKGGVRRVLKSVENKARKKAVGVGSIIRFLAGSETEGGRESGWKKKRKK